MPKYIFKFIYEKNSYDIPIKSGLLNEAIYEYFSILKSDTSNLYFLCNGKEINLSNTNSYTDFKINTNRKYLPIFVFNIKRREKLVNENTIYCPKCSNVAMIEFINNKISINNCINHHSTNDLTFYDFIENQKFSEKKIICNLCYNNKSMYSKFYSCLCGILLCPLCSAKHNTDDKKHAIISYESRSFLCNAHIENFTSYCKNCKKNLCSICEVEHIHHQTFLYKLKMPNKGQIIEIKNKIEETKKDIHMFNNKLKQTENMINKIFYYLRNNIDGYYIISDKMYNLELVNYESINNFKNYSNYNYYFSKEIFNVLNKDIKYRIQYIIDQINKIPKNEMTMTYRVEGNEIKLFGTKFFERYKDYCFLIIDGKITKTIEKYKVQRNINKSFIKVTLVEKKIISNFNNMFSDCPCLSYIEDADKWDTINVTDMSSLFSNCTSLIFIRGINSWNIINVKDLSNIFNNCKNLKMLPDISKWNCSNVNNISSMFCNCEQLKELPDISKWDISNVTTMKNLFANCCFLWKMPDISNWDTSKVIDMSYLFYNCKNLISLPDISKWKTLNLENISYMFSKCSLLTYLPDISKWNSKNLIFINNLFENCSSLKILPDISLWNTKNIKELSYIFAGCSS